MDQQNQKWENIIQWLCFGSATIAIILVFVFILLQAYIRWTINQNFVFLGGAELEVLTASAFVSLLGLAYLNRPSRM